MVYLASNSPRRRQLLALTGWAFIVRPADIDEQPYSAEPPADYVLRLARGKAQAVGVDAVNAIAPGGLILAADTTVAVDEQILGKPADAGEARAMLSSLRGRAHTVYTAVAVADPHSGQQRAELAAAQVWMRDYTDDEIEAYIASGDPFDKAGAYAIQNSAFHPVDHIEGCYNCVVGLPLCRVVSLLAEFGLTPPVAVTAGCPASLAAGSACQVYTALRAVEQGGSQTVDRPETGQV